MKTVTWQPVDEAPVAKVQVTVMLPLSSITAVEDWRPVVSMREIGESKGEEIGWGWGRGEGGEGRERKEVEIESHVRQ